jgi:hypothetical protein
MADRRDDIDDWLGERINPLPPPPGTFDLIKRRARRRKIRRLVITATSAAVIVAAAVTVPQVVNLPVLNPATRAGVAAGQSSAATPTSQSRTESSAATPRPSASVSSAAASAPVPANFRPTSVTFIGTHTGWVIGQAGTPGHCATQYCTSMARTDNAGHTWTGVPAPYTGAPAGATGVSQIRFLNLQDGWAFGPELWVTHNGGQTWTQVNTHGLRVTDLEAVGSRAYALFASCTGGGQAFAAQCTSFTLYSSPAAGSGFTPVGATTTGLTDSTAGGAAGEAAALVLTGSRGYLLAPGGALYAGPVDGTAAWPRVGALVSSCTVGPAQPDGQPSQALLGAVKAKELLLACTSAASTSSDIQDKQIFSSPNGGVSWLLMARAPAAGIAYSLAASPSESAVLGTDRGIDLLPAGDIAWQMATLVGGGPAGGFSYVGMTNDVQGVALPANPSAGTVWFTFNGGQSWKPSRLSG